MVSSIIACIIQCITSFWPVYPNNLFMRLLCFLYHLCSQVVLLGDLNYRISLEGAETRSLVKAKNWAILLENDQVYFLCQTSSTCHLNHFLKILNAVVSLSFNRSYYLSSLGGGISRGGRKGWSRSPPPTSTTPTPISTTGASMVPGARRSVRQHGELKSPTHLPFLRNIFCIMQ